MSALHITAPGRGLFAIQLAVITDLTLELARSGSEGELCHRAVELGRERLGFDRLDMKFFTHEDVSANCRRCPLRFYPEAECIDAAGAVLGRADRAVALLWDGERALGELVADNLPSGRPIDGGSLELLVLYARTIGHMLSKARAEEELRLQASTDLLTGVMNRRVCLMFLDKQLGLAARGGSPLSIAYIDLDGLKSVNDGFGHAEGDAYIAAISSILLSSVRTSDVVGRLGGDEFLVIFPDCQAEPAETVMRRIRQTAVERAPAAGKPYKYSLSWGVASLGELPAQGRAPGAAALVELADKRMYEDKMARKAGR